jgi:hypothetical protein
MKIKQPVNPGTFYKREPSGRLVPTADTGQPDVWVCRRVADYPRLPEGAATTVCCRCHAPIAFNPARTVDAPKVCMQCAGIEPLPFE